MATLLAALAAPLSVSGQTPATVPASVPSQTLPPVPLDARQTELIYVATVDARIRLRDSISQAPLYRTWTIQQAARRLRATDTLAKAIAGAELAGSPRFQESGICQVRVELPGSAIADVLTIAAQSARDQDLSPPKLTDSLTRLRTQSFFAVGESVSPGELGRVKADFSPAWLAVPPGVRADALKMARADAMRRFFDQIRPVQLDRDHSVGDVLAMKEPMAGLQNWLADRPVSGLEFRTGLECRVTLAVAPDQFWPAFQNAIGQTTISPSAADGDAWKRLQVSMDRAVLPVIGTAKAGGPAVKPVVVPASAPTWATEQIEANGRSAMSGLKGARLAEADALAALRQKVLDLPLGSMKLAEAADRDPTIHRSVETFVQQARLSRVVYQAEGASVSVSADLAQLWRMILISR